MRLLTLVWLRLIPLSACTLSSMASDFHGLRDDDNSIPTHINSTHYALQLFVVVPFIGDASLKTAVAEFTREAKELGATRVRIVQSDTTRLWWISLPCHSSLPHLGQMWQGMCCARNGQHHCRPLFRSKALTRLGTTEGQ
jgi:hypothetical protein